MRFIQIFLLAVVMAAFTPANAQTADEIIDIYFENTGGVDNWRKLKGVEMQGKMNMQGMEIALQIVSLKDSRQYTQISFQGQELKQGVFDGTTMWGVNFMTGQPEKMETEMVENFKKNEAKDFPTPLLDYKEKGYSVELLGKETMEGTECFKVKLTKNPIMVNGKEEDVVSIYYFDTENMVPIAEEMVSGSMMQGPPGQEGQKMITTFSDYDEVDGLYFAFTMKMPQGEMVMDSISLNPEVTDDAFIMPELAVEETGNK